MINLIPKDCYDFADLVGIMAILRSPQGCPWDREQTHESIRKNFVEEVYEALDAIDQKDDANLREELGDVLLQVVFHAQIAQEGGRFGIDAVVDEICKQLVSRHPHIFGQGSAQTAQEVVASWDAIKQAQKHQTTVTQTLEQIPHSLPALLYADKMQNRARKGGFDWPDISYALAKLREETQEVEQALESGQGFAEEVGDLLFAAVSVARKGGVDPEEALYRASQKFLGRFSKVEANAPSPLSQLSIEELIGLWKAAKE